MSSVNARVPPLRLLAIDNPSDGEVAAYQASSGRFEWVAQSGGGGGGTVTSITLVADAGTGTALTTSGTFTFTGATGISTSVSWTTVTITGPDLTPYVDGSGASSQVAYWSDSDTITGSSNLTFDGTNLSVGGYIKSGGVYDTTGATDLTLKTNGGSSSGQVDLKNGADGNLIFTPNGAGLLQIEGSTNPGAIKLMCEAGTHGITIESAPHSANATYKLVLPDALPADADNKYLVSDTSGNLSFTSAGSGGSPGGADTNVQFNDGGSFGGESTFTYNKTTNTVTVSNYLTANNTILGYNTGIITTTTTNNIDLKPYYGISGGRILIPSADGSNITITPGGSGKVEFNGAYTFPSADGSANQVLQTDGAGSLSFATVSGGGGTPGGSDTQVQYNNGGSFGGMASMTFDDTAGAEQILISDSSTSTLVKIEQSGSGNAFEVHDEATDTTVFYIQNNGNTVIGLSAATGTSDKLYVSGSMYCDRYRSGGQSATTPAFSYSSQASGLFFASGYMGLSVDGTERIRLTDKTEIGIAGANYGTSGQVLTSNGAGNAVSWTTPSGGSSGPPLSGVTYPAGINWYGSQSSKRFRLNSLPPYGTKATTNSSYSSSTDYDGTFYFPFYASQTGTVNTIEFNIITAASDGTLAVGVYSAGSGTNQYPATLLGKGDVSITSTGNKTITSFTDGSGSSTTISLTQGTLYYIGYCRTSSGEAFNAYGSNDVYSASTGLNLGVSESYVSLGGIIRSYATETSLPSSIASGSPTWDDFTYGNASWNRIVFGMEITV